MVEEPQGQGGLDGKIRVPPLPTQPAAPAGRPGSDCFPGQPHRHIAASNEGLIVGRPVRNAVLRLIRGMDLRLRPRSVAPAEDHEKCGPNHPTPAGSSCNNAVFHRDGIPIRRWRTAWRTACQAAGVPTRFLHDCRRTAARNLIRASVPERVAMLLTGHKTRAIFDRYNIINEQELLEAGDQLVAYLAQHAQATPRGGRPHPARTATPRTAPPLRLVRRTTA